MCAVVERNSDRLSGKWVFAGTWLIAELFEKLNDGASLDEFLELYEGIERSDAERIIDCQLELLQAVRGRSL